MVRELATIEDITETEAGKQVEAYLLKGPKRGPKTEEAVPEKQDEAA
jgi:hypothetical protein